MFISLNKFLIARPLYRNVPEGADADISLLPGGDDPLVSVVGADAPMAELVAEAVD